jgi:hypothetical protein
MAVHHIDICTWRDLSANLLKRRARLLDIDTLEELSDAHLIEAFINRFHDAGHRSVLCHEHTRQNSPIAQMQGDTGILCSGQSVSTVKTVTMVLPSHSDRLRTLCDYRDSTAIAYRRSSNSLSLTGFAQILSLLVFFTRSR